MSNETFEFSPRVGLVMANIKVVREIKKVLDEESEIDIKQLSKYIRDNLIDLVPELQSWKCEIVNDKYLHLKFFAGDHWKVRDDYIYICIELPYGTNLLDEDDPWVGLYVPEEWKKRKLFYETLDKSLSRSFKNFWEEPDDVAPIWAYVKYEKYSKGDVFDSMGFLQNIAELVSKIVKIKDIIDNNIKQVQK